MPLFGRNDQSVTANSSTTAESTTGAAVVPGGAIFEEVFLTEIIPV